MHVLRRTLLTFDKHFGELAYARRLPATCGVVLFRLAGTSPEEAAQISVAAILKHRTLEGHFSVVTRNNVRIRLLPSSQIGGEV